MIQCQALTALVSDYADGIADARARRIVERHIQLCADCRQHVCEAADISQQLARIALLPAGVAARIPRLRRTLEQAVTQREP